MPHAAAFAVTNLEGFRHVKLRSLNSDQQVDGDHDDDRYGDGEVADEASNLRLLEKHRVKKL